jgi:hypothetical protein
MEELEFEMHVMSHEPTSPVGYRESSRLVASAMTDYGFLC